MQIKNLAVFLFSATALATVEKRDQMDDKIEEYLSSAKYVASKFSQNM